MAEQLGRKLKGNRISQVFSVHSGIMFLPWRIQQTMPVEDSYHPIEAVVGRSTMVVTISIIWPPQIIARMQSYLPEVRANSVVCHESIEEDHIPWKKFFSFKVLLRIAAWCRRFGYNCHAQLSKRILDPVLTPEEIFYIQHVLLQLAQDEFFPVMVAALQEGKKPSGTKSLLSLELFLDKDVLIRVEGKLKHSGLP